MTEWLYAWRPRYRQEDWFRELAEMGEEGWELVQFVPREGELVGGYIFKKPVDEAIEDKTTDLELRLKPCPFCGGDAVYRGYKHTLVYVVCHNCSARGTLCPSSNAAATSWNRRV